LDGIHRKSADGVGHLFGVCGHGGHGGFLGLGKYLPREIAALLETRRNMPPVYEPVNAARATLNNRRKNAMLLL
jgi:hypothetical protein